VSVLMNEVFLDVVDNNFNVVVRNIVVPGNLC